MNQTRDLLKSVRTAERKLPFIEFASSVMPLTGVAIELLGFAAGNFPVGVLGLCVVLLQFPLDIWAVSVGSTIKVDGMVLDILTDDGVETA